MKIKNYSDLKAAKSIIEKDIEDRKNRKNERKNKVFGFFNTEKLDSSDSYFTSIKNNPIASKLMEHATQAALAAVADRLLKHSIKGRILRMAIATGLSFITPDVGKKINDFIRKKTDSRNNTTH